MNIEQDVKLDFNDVLIKPKRSQAVSRSEVDLTRKFKFLNCEKYYDDPIDVGIPIIAANMFNIGTIEMAKALAKHNCWTALHKFYSTEEIERFFKEEYEAARRTFYTTGISENDFEKLKTLYKLAVPLPYICIDVPNGYMQTFVDKCKEIRNMFGRSVIMAGNVVSSEMTQELLLVGKVDIVKCGIGGGSACTSRLVAGIGVPQLSVVIECADSAHGIGGHICSDGGIRYPADFCKAIGAGADFTMAGGIFSGHDQCSGDFTYDEQGNKKSMVFYGMSSDTAMKKHYGSKASYRASEGRTIEIPYKGSIDKTIEEILGGLRSTCTYVGTTKLKDLSKCTTFIKVNRVHDNITYP